MAFSQTELRNLASQKTASVRGLLLNESQAATAKTDGRKTAFLCHSHLDEDLACGLVAKFQQYGISLYVDWQDSSMPATTSAITAKKIQSKIQTTDYFLFLATTNSLASKWCPWELGFADSKAKRIYIIPTTNNTITYGNEYMELYPRLEEGESKINKEKVIAAFDPTKNDGVIFKV